MVRDRSTPSDPSRYLQLLELMGEAVLVVEQGRIREASQRFEELSRRSHAAVVGEHIERLLSPLSRRHSPPRQDSNPERGHSRHMALLLREADEPLLVEIRSAQTRFEERPAELWVISDASERQRMQRELQKSRQLESIAALSGGIAHDYNNLLTAIIGNISLAKSYLKAEAPPFQLLSEALDASLLAKDLTQKLITFSKGGSPVTQTTAIAPLIRGATEFSLSGSNIMAEFFLPENLWPVKIDVSQVGQAIHNLVINAREAMPRGGTIHVSAENLVLDGAAMAVDPGRYLRITIKDQGVGIPEENLERIFDPYFSTKEKGDQKGTGLGLSICHSIVSQHGGVVTVDSSPGEGAAFHVFLPASSEEIDREAPLPHTEEQLIMGRGRILVMDDEERIRQLIGHMLGLLGYKVAFATTGEEALALYQEAIQFGTPFDAVILDLTVRGGMGGKDAMAELQKIDPEVKAIVSSGYSNDPVMASFQKYGFRDMVAKPYSMAELSQSLRRVLAGAEPE